MTVELPELGTAAVWLAALALMTWGTFGGPVAASRLAMVLLAVATVWSIACLMARCRAKMLEAFNLQLTMRGMPQQQRSNGSVSTLDPTRR